MINKFSFILVNNIKLPFYASFEEAFSVALKKLKAWGVRADLGDCFVYKRSIDARKKDNILFVWSIAIRSGLSPQREFGDKDIVAVEYKMPEYTVGADKLSSPPVIVGAGPCGLFAGLILAENGYAPIIVERGSCVSERKKTVSLMNEKHVLDTECNIQFGAGGAGTFSDGKLVTRINDPLCNYVLDKFVEFGAPDDVKYVAKPHVGTDYLCKMTDNIINRITSLGGRILYNTRYLSNVISNGRIVAVNTTKGEIKAGAVILAVGHSARDVYSYMLEQEYDVVAKPFSVGMRIEHLASRIDEALYGRFAHDDRLGHGEYNLSTNTKKRGVYTFCMCPGGYVVAAASENGGVVVNGMSERARDGINSNCAVACSIFPEDYGTTPTEAIAFQRKIEQKAFIAGGGDYAAPIVTVGDFLAGKASAEPTEVIPTYMSGENVRIASPDEYLPSFVTASIRDALCDFDKKIKGFASPTAILTGAETRTSAPVRIIRCAETRALCSIDNFYPAGEGAGYAGGITSAAIDGLKTAIAIINRYRPYCE